MNRLCQAAISALALIICSSGCTSETALPTYPTAVEVVFPNGHPIPGAQVTFRLAEDHKITAYGKADVDGVCHLTTYEQGDGAALGQHQAVVAAPAGKGDLDDAKLLQISPKYANYSSSGLTFTVTDDEKANHFKIVVTKD